MVKLEITRLPGIVQELAPEMEELVSRLYSWYVEPGHLVFPDAMQEWVQEKYGDIEAQQIVRVTNNQTDESTLFNSIRARRPVLTPRAEETLELQALSEGGPFANPLDETPADTFGRIDGDHWITASNIAKYDYLHALIIAKESTPYVTTEPQVADMISVAVRWCQEAHRANPRAVYPFLVWNSLWRAGASIVHNHAQILLTHQPYTAPVRIERTRDEYRCRYGSEYYDDLFRAHTAIGLGLVYKNARVMAHLTPKKEHEVVIIATLPHDLAPALAKVLECYQNIGVQSYNAAVYMPPLGEEGHYVAWLVDRGDLHSRTSDIGGMELYAGTPVVASDPFRLMEHLAAVMQP
ncbi:hypothetical protein [Methanoculleus sp.]|uniref:hypothetical protein n=1 Tax=Methanoculleus sp. TaxID=90427 RepID=UPI0025E7DF66|nr:hypothetical protein [Methanoculleus sp.]